MNAENRCPACDAELPANAPRGLCPDCLLKQGLQTTPLPSEGQANADFVPPTPAELAPHFPDLEILELVGRGGMGMVYKARQKRLDRFVALKILAPKIGQDPAFAERFAREARAMAMLNHPHIVAVYDFGQTVKSGEQVAGSGEQGAGSGEQGAGSADSGEGDSSLPSPVLGRGAGREGDHGEGGLYYFLMEFVDGLNLRQLLDTGKLAPEEALAIVPQICEALQYAHDHGVVHRDIKPENVLLDKEGRVKIADFGIAKLVGREAPDTALTGAGQIVGTPQYMAPEQIEHPLQVDHRADIYSLGVVFYQMLTGELPIGRFAAPSKKVQIDVRLDEVVLRALEKEPEQRYQQANEIKTRVETIAQTKAGKSSGARAANNLPLFVERAGRLQVYWPAVLFACGTVGLVVLGINLALALALWLLNAVPWPMFHPHELPWVVILMAACAVMRLAALKLGSSEAVRSGPVPAAKVRTAPRIIVLFLTMAMAAIGAFGFSFFAIKLRAVFTTALADSLNKFARIAVWIALAVAVAWYIIRRVWFWASKPQEPAMRVRRLLLLIAGGLAVILFLAFCPADLEIRGKGTLEPVDCKDVYAGVEGQIYEFETNKDGKPIEHGSWVKQGQLLLKLRNPALNAQKAEINGQMAIVAQHANDIRHELTTSAGLRPDERARLEGQLAEAEQKLVSLHEQAAIIAANVAELDVRSPIDGQIVTWDLTTQLEGRPVQKGQLLLRVANPDGDWEAILHIPEDQIGQVARAKKAADERNEQLPVSYILATDPGTTLKGTVKEIVRSAESEEKDKGNEAVIKAAINKQDIEPANLREGGTVTAEVNCGRRSLGYVFFHGLIGFIGVRSNSGTEDKGTPSP